LTRAKVTSQPEAQPGPTGFMEGWSLEATLPKPADMERLQDVLRANTPIYLSALPHMPHQRLLDAARLVRRAGFEPVPHLAVRNYASEVAVRDFLARARNEAGVTRALVIAGDRDHACGPFTDALQVINSGMLQEAGIVEIGISGYPDGHPNINEQTLETALRDKLAAARTGGLGVHVVTQFCFSHTAITAWLRRYRPLLGKTLVRVGLAGPTNAPTLLKYALRCGVRASAGNLTRGLGLLRQQSGDALPAGIITQLGREWAGTPVAVHLFSFGGIGRTATWAERLATRP